MQDQSCLDPPVYVNKHSQYWISTNSDTDPLSLIVIALLFFVSPPYIQPDFDAFVKAQ